jgi:hypothetical protein
MKTVSRFFCFGLLFFLYVIPSTGQSNTKASTPQGCSTSQRESQAQGHTVALSGKVTDKEGHPVSDAKVALLPDCDCQQRCPKDPTCSCCPPQVAAYTDEVGNYQADVQPGKYSVSVAGKKKMVDVRATGKANINFKVDMAKERSEEKKDK